MENKDIKTIEKELRIWKIIMPGPPGMNTLAL
jgi:hypothetical protein